LSEGIDMLYRVFISLLALCIAGGASGQIRVVSYNSAQFNGDANAMVEVLQAASDDDSHGFAIPVSIFLFQEVDEAELATLQSVVGAGYTMGTFTDQNDSSWGDILLCASCLSKFSTPSHGRRYAHC